MEFPLTTRAALLQALRDGPGFGTDLMKRLNQMTIGERSPGPGTVYPALRDLEGEGLVRSWTRQVSGSRGRPRRYYELTIQGVAEAADLRRLLSELARRPMRVGTKPDKILILSRLRRSVRASAFGMRLRELASSSSSR